ncbi:hypothetical protein [Dactylosporangium sp. NPDC049140]|uniref:hypothetical protein n=1 Tax=Dactylosporangium sp. NPDC049140 TaxID=3155647 RepID=UPI0033FA1BBD
MLVTMRTGTTGIYYGADGWLDYSMCMLRTTRLNGYYRDPILLQVRHSSGAGERVEDPWFTGYETTPRWLRLQRRGVGMRSIDRGFALDVPDGEALRAKLADIFDRHGVVHTADGVDMLPIPRQEGAGGLDAIDRVVAGASLLRDLVQAGL